MPDNKQDRGTMDRQRISVNEDYELNEWSERLGTTPDQLKAAVKVVGPMAEDVRAYLQKSPAGQTQERGQSAEPQTRPLGEKRRGGAGAAERGARAAGRGKKSSTGKEATTRSEGSTSRNSGIPTDARDQTAQAGAPDRNESKDPEGESDEEEN